ncbi:MAG: DUF2029 domain-containing protein [Candidatus Lokiarchaeota archaeon]|nr:DUF2029 domain-containing protein [Candidatus Lokiarchaeota archaeon]
MGIQKVMVEYKNKFLMLWRFTFIKIAILIQIGYLIVSTFLFFTVFSSENDFILFYNAGYRIINDINNLYLKESIDFFFRYFPFSAFFYTPFSLWDFTFGYFSFMMFNLLLNIGICILIYKIIKITTSKRIDKERLSRFLALFLGAAPQVNNYILGQNNLLVIFVLLASLYIFIKYNSLKYEFLASLLIGISINIKPITILIIPFLLVFLYHSKKDKIIIFIKRTISSLIGVSLILLPNIFLFFYFPKLWEGFINNNFGGVNIVSINHSFSISKLILNLFVFFNLPYNQFIILLISLLLFGGFSLYLFGKCFSNENSLIFGFAYGILIMLLAYFDSWNHHLLVLIPLLIIILFNIPENGKISTFYFKPSLLYYVFLDLLFMGIWFSLRQWFPFNFVSTVFLILNFYGISKYLNRSKR